MPVPRLFDIRRPSGASTVEWMITSRERDLAEQEEPGEDHPVLPEADDLARGRVDVARVVARELRRLAPASRASRTARAPTRTTCRARPGRARARPTPHSAQAVGRRPRARQVAVGARPDRDLVPPPELARDAPVGRLLERLDREPVLALRVVADAPLAQRLDRRARELVHRAPPLRRDERLDPRVAALAGADRVAVGLPLLELAALLEPRDDPLVGLLLRQPSKPSAAFMRPSGPITVSVGSPWSRPISKSSGSWPGRDLERAGAELRLDALVGDHRHAALDHRHDDLPADGVAVALVLRVHGDRDVGEDRRGAHGRDRDPSPVPSANG